ncbi:RDD family protein [Chitinophaga ginsengisoli]|uniref:Putative RDD family membrane protein YckC n=1 Tax=Chitinophaga ginsengisoli TaxID=363837 RepID=A0A2P8G6S3_9BACT|nr:RDD family protein [Chitinophaga ginsengisoli]PSL29683.1 putative RDD family membrane protein YckC [Chitinophaga ginsengisoli]
MASIKIPTSFNIDLEFETANLFQRFLGWLLDTLIRLVYCIALGYTVYNMQLGEVTSYVVYFFLGVLPMLFYFLVLEIIMNGQTPGKLIMNIKVRNMQGGKPSISQHLIRWLFRMLETPYIFWNGIIPIIAMLRSPYDQRLGDIVAGTIVVSTKTKASLNDTIFRDMSAVDYQPHFPQILKLSDRDMNKIKTLMDQAIKSNNPELAARVAYRVRDVLEIKTDMQPVEFLETVLNDYNYYTTR